MGMNEEGDGDGDDVDDDDDDEDYDEGDGDDEDNGTYCLRQWLRGRDEDDNDGNGHDEDNDVNQWQPLYTFQVKNAQCYCEAASAIIASSLLSTLPAFPS